MLKTSHKILIATLLNRILLVSRSFLGLGSDVTTIRHGIKWQLDLNEGIDFSIYLLGSFEPLTQKQFRRFVQKDDVVIDIGANIGAHTLPLAQKVGENGRVIAVEPTMWASQKLRNSVALNKGLSSRIEIKQCMLVSGDKDLIPDNIYSSWPLEKLNDNYLHKEHKGRLMSTAGSGKSTLDELIKELNLEKVNVIKLDVDGNEYSVLKGAHRTISRFHPIIFMELAPYVFDEAADFDGLIELLCAHGYQFTNITGSKKIPSNPIKIRELIPVGGSMNVLARVCK